MHRSKSMGNNKGNWLMAQVSLKISPELATLWPQTAVGYLIYSPRVQRKNQAMWEYLNNTVVPPLTKELETRPIADYPRLAAGREAYRAFGKDPGRHRTSAEALYRRLRQNKALYQINSVVDANNLVSIETAFPLGSYDTDRIGTHLELRLGQEEELYQALGKGVVTLGGYPVLVDESGPFGCPTSDSMRAMISEGTTNALTVVYSFSGAAPLEEALKMTRSHLFAYAGVRRFSQKIVAATGG